METEKNWILMFYNFVIWNNQKTQIIKSSFHSAIPLKFSKRLESLFIQFTFEFTRFVALFIEFISEKVYYILRILLHLKYIWSNFVIKLHFLNINNLELVSSKISAAFSSASQYAIPSGCPDISRLRHIYEVALRVNKQLINFRIGYL